MRKIVLGIFLILMLVGCNKKDESSMLDDLNKKIDSANSYYLIGNLEMVNNESSYNYDVEVSYKKENNFKVSLKNQTNEHEQVILRNEEGVYVINHKSYN